MVSTQYFLSYVSRTMDCESPEERLLVIVASNSPRGVGGGLPYETDGDARRLA